MSCCQHRSWMAGLLLACAGLMAQDKPLPEPLTLDDALARAPTHPQVQQSAAQLSQAQAEYQQIEAQDRLHLDFSARLSALEREQKTKDTPLDDHRLNLTASQRLYDFGRQQHRLQAANAQTQQHHWNYLDAQNQQRLTILRHYLAVLLADKRYDMDNETMALAFVQFDRAKARHALKQIADLELLRQENHYQQARHQQVQSQQQQLRTRSLLAAAINQPNSLPKTLQEPDLNRFPAPTGTLEQLNAQARQHNPTLLALGQKIQALQQQQHAHHAQRYPTLNLEVATNVHSLELSTHDRWRADLLLTVPLYDSGKTQADKANIQAQLEAAQAQLQLAQNNLQQVLLEHWLKREELQSEQQRLQTLANLRELDFDHSRSLYEMEVQADLGESMVGQSEINWLKAQLIYNTLLLHAELHALLGETIP